MISLFRNAFLIYFFNCLFVKKKIKNFSKPSFSKCPKIKSFHMACPYDVSLLLVQKKKKKKKYAF